MNASRAWVSVCVVVGLLAGTASAVNIETVPVGNPGNAGSLSGAGAGGYGPDRICGAVDYTYNIGKYEVTAGQYTEFLNAVAETDTYGLYNTKHVETPATAAGSRGAAAGPSAATPTAVAADWANRPVNYVSFWGDAARFANWLHNGQPTGAQGRARRRTGRTPQRSDDGMRQLLAVQRNADWKWAVTSEDEWYKAAYYKGGATNAGYWDYPTSSDTAPGRDMADASGNNANYYTGSGPYPIDSGKYTTVVGEFQNSDSPYGTFDQGGNVWEWNEASFSNLDGSFRGLRGGSFGDTTPPARVVARQHRPDGGVLLIGFRVSEVPEPCSAALLLLGTLGVFRLCSIR